MLPEHIDPGERDRFVTNESRGFHIGFFRFEPGEDRPLACHWMQECGDQRSLRAMLRWLAVRREKWTQWGRLADAVGREAFARHMEQLMQADPIEEVVSTIVQKQDDPSNVGFGEMLAGRAGLRTEVLYIHRFRSAPACERFFEWFCAGRNSDQASALLNIAYNSGTAQLGKLLDELAENSARRPKRRGRTDKKNRLAA